MTTFSYFLTDPRAPGSLPRSSATCDDVETAARGLAAMVPAHLRPDVDELRALRVGQCLVLPRGRFVTRGHS